MHKAAGGALAAFLLASPLLLLFSAVDNKAPNSTWQAQPSRFLEYARRQPGRLAALAGRGDPPLKIEQVIKDTAGSVTNIPEATANSLGSAFKTLASYSEGGYLAVKHLTLENLRQLHKISAEGFSAVKHFSSNSLTSVRSFSAGILTPVEGFWEGGLSSVHHLTMGGLASVGRFSLENYLALKRGAEGGVATLKHSSVEGLRSTLQSLEAGYLAVRPAVRDVGARLSHPLGLGRGVADSLSLGKLKQHVSELGERGVGLVKQGWEWVGPGGKLHPEEFLERFHGHLVIEALLAIVIGYLFFQQSFKWSMRKNPKLLSEEEIDELCNEWVPEPLHTTLPDNKLVYKTPVITSATEKFMSVEGVEGDVLNMVAFDFLGASYDLKILDKELDHYDVTKQSLQDICKATVSKYGVGACGPRGFYGTIDVHLHLEKRLATFMGQEESIIYAYDLSTIPSVLPAFANAKDLIIVDEAVDYSIQNGGNLSRAKIATFKHNDVEDLERVIKSELDMHNALRKPLNRRFIVVEGLYKATGELAPLDAICRLKHAHKFRLVVDESLAFGVLGKTGRGACQHYGLQREDVEIICASMGNALASVGGFCVGDREITDHQRLSGLGYCFSAALPPYLATAAMGALDTLDSPDGQYLLAKTQQNAGYLRSRLARLDGFMVVGDAKDAISPVVHVQLADSADRGRHEALQALQDIADSALQRSRILFTVTKTSALDRVQLTPTLRIAVTAKHNNEDIDDAVAALKTAHETVLGAA